MPSTRTFLQCVLRIMDHPLIHYKINPSTIRFSQIVDCRLWKHILTYKKINFCNGAFATSLTHLSLWGLDLVCRFDFLAHSIIKLPQLLWVIDPFVASISTVDLTPFSLCTEAFATLLSHWYSYGFNLYHWYDFLANQHLPQCGLWNVGFIL